jgi:rhodanese-related sulfurtransferase
MSGIDTYLAEARSHLKRVTPQELAALKSGDTLVIDTRPLHNREAEGEIPDSIPVERIVLEWRLDPDGDHRLPGFTADTTVVVLCNEGYSSSLAARDLQRIGLPKATDLIGGFRAWAAAGLPVREGGTQAVT